MLLQSRGSRVGIDWHGDSWQAPGTGAEVPGPSVEVRRECRDLARFVCAECVISRLDENCWKAGAAAAEVVGPVREVALIINKMNNTNY